VLKIYDTTDGEVLVHTAIGESSKDLKSPLLLLRMEYEALGEAWIMWERKRGNDVVAKRLAPPEESPAVPMSEEVMEQHIIEAFANESTFEQARDLKVVWSMDMGDLFAAIRSEND
jgi:hypothetical protein